MSLFETDPSVSRAYLARVTYSGPQGTWVGLCIRAETGHEETLVASIAAVFASLFAKDVPLDIMFVTKEEEAELAKCCRPFFDAADHRHANASL